MDFEKKVPEWDNVGAEPDAQLKKEGFKAGYKPPAAYFNWFFNRISEVAKELQEKAGNEIDNKPDASGGDISDTVITSAEEPKDDYPVPAAGDSTKVFLGKTRKFFSNIKNWMTGVCLLGQIVNNCVTDNAKLPLSAAQGKALMDLYNVLNTKAKNMQRSYLGNLGNVASGSVTLPGLSRCKWLIIVPYGGQPSAPAIIVGGGIRFSGVATDANIASIYEVGFRITGDTLTFSFNKAYLVPGGTEFQMTFGDVYGIIE